MRGVKSGCAVSSLLTLVGSLLPWFYLASPLGYRDELTLGIETEDGVLVFVLGCAAFVASLLLFVRDTGQWKVLIIAVVTAGVFGVLVGNWYYGQTSQTTSLAEGRDVVANIPPGFYLAMIGSLGQVVFGTWLGIVKFKEVD